MKKYILSMVVAIVAILSSCSNEEITISKTVNFTVNPATVVEPYTSSFSDLLSIFDINRGVLESFNTNYKLRVRLFVYDNNGVLVQKASGNYSNYDVKLKESFYLSVGSYTAIAISDIYRTSDGFEYWAVSGEDLLATLKITDTGYFGGERTILGVTKQAFKVDDKGIDVNIDIKAAGALFLNYYQNIFTYTGVTEYELSVNKLQSSINYDSEGNYSISTENHNGSYDWRISSVVLDEIDQTQYSGAIRWATQLPMNNVGVCFSYWTSTASSSSQMGSGKVLDIKAGDTYFCWLYLDSDGNTADYWTTAEFYKWFNSSRSHSRSVASTSQIALFPEDVKDVKRHDATVGQFLYPKNL